MTKNPTRSNLILPAAALALAAAVASAPAPLRADDGEDGKRKCGAEATVCVREMAANLKERGWIGIEMGDADEQGRPRVTGVVPNSPAERAGFETGDSLVAFNGVGHGEGDELINAEVKRALIPGNEITVTVERGGETHEIAVTLSRVPDYLLAQWVGQHMLGYHSEVETAEADSEDADSDTDSDR